jgi:hypothetical protein
MGLQVLQGLRPSLGRHILYRGPLILMGGVRMGRWRPGEKRRFTFAAWLPDGGVPPSPVTGDKRLPGLARQGRLHPDREALTGRDYSNESRSEAVASAGDSPRSGTPRLPETS